VTTAATGAANATVSENTVISWLATASETARSAAISDSTPATT
jgi:hypothetical protein